MKKTVLITGGSGMVGSELLLELLNRKNLAYNIRVFDQDTRANQKYYQPYTDRIQWFRGDIRKEQDLEMPVKGVDVIIHLAAVIPPAADHYPKLAKEVNFEGTQNLIKAAEQYAPNAFFLYASSVSYYGDRLKNPWIKVGDPFRPSEGDYYAETKKWAEDSLQASQLDWSIFRLSAIFAYNMKPNPLLFHMPLDTNIEFTTSRDTGYAFAQAIEKQQELKGRIFNLGGGAHCRITYRDFLQTSFEGLGLGKHLLPNRAFAEHNFHCGYYEDGHLLNDILNFQRDTKKAYFEGLTESMGSIKRALATLGRPMVRWYLMRSSEPLQAIRNNDPALISRFYKSMV